MEQISSYKSCGLQVEVAHTFVSQRSDEGVVLMVSVKETEAYKQNVSKRIQFHENLELTNGSIPKMLHKMHTRRLQPSAAQSIVGCLLYSSSNWRCLVMHDGLPVLPLCRPWAFLEVDGYFKSSDISVRPKYSISHSFDIFFTYIKNTI